jgi:hypothetical protein
MRVFALACNQAQVTGRAEVDGQSLWQQATAAGIDRVAFEDAVQVLRSKQLITVAWPMGRGALPTLVTISPHGLELFLRHTIDNYDQIRQQVACQIIQGLGSSQKIEVCESSLALQSPGGRRVRCHRRHSGAQATLPGKWYIAAASRKPRTTD